jgi:hypothetical protein
MFLFDTIKAYLDRLKPIGRLGTRELRHEKIRLEHMEGRLGEEVDRLERLKRVLFLRGKGETEAGRLTLARKIKELDARARAKEGNRALCREHIRILSRLLEIKEREELRRELHAALPAAWRFRQKLTEWVGGAMAWESREWGQGIAMRESDEWALDPSLEEESDKDLVTIVAAMEDARAAEDAGDAEGAAEAFRRIEAHRPHDGSMPEPV